MYFATIIDAKNAIMIRDASKCMHRRVFSGQHGYSVSIT